MRPAVQPPAPSPHAAARRRRGPVRRVLETRGLVGGHDRPAAEVVLRAADGVRLAASYLPGAGPRGGPAVLLVHGFAANRRKPAYARLADGLADHVPVLSLDLRGHGRSRGTSTFGDAEAADVAAGVAWLRGYGHTGVVAVGVSMGATAVLHAVWQGTEVDGVVLVSAPARFRSPAPPGPLRRLETLWHSPVQRVALAALLGVSLGRPALWRSPPDPVVLATAVHVPMLVVHGADDAYFPPRDADDLAAAARGPVTMWHEPAGFGHAEDGFSPAFVARFAAAVADLAPGARD